MSKIRVFLMLMLLMVFVFASCNQENVVPDSAQAQVDLNQDDGDEGDDYDDDDDGDDGDEDEEEEEEGEEIDPASLPEAILDYISENYPDAEIVEAEVYPNGDYEVELDNDLELLFDADGNFLGEGD